MSKQEKELVVIEPTTALAAFSKEGGLDTYVEQVREAVRNFEHDMGTATSRKRTASISAKVSKIKVKLDSLGKDSTADLKAKAKLVDASRKAMRDELDALRDEARKPLTDWEQDQAKIEQEKLAAEAAEKNAKQHVDRAAEPARQAEVTRQERETAEAEAKQAKLEAHRRHVGSIRKAAKESLISKGVDEALAKSIVLAIANGQIANVTINY